MGANYFGELGNGTAIPSNTPVMVTGMNNVKFYTTGYIAAAIKNDSTAWAWGNLINAQGSQYQATNPVLMQSNVKFTDAAMTHVVFVKYDSTVWAVGSNDGGQLGNGTTGFSTLPVQMTGVSNAVRAVAVGVYSEAATIILCADRTVKITGGYPYFNSINSTIPITMPGLSNIVDIKGGTNAAYALNASGEVYSFGTNYHGGLGLGIFSTNDPVPPTKIIFPAGAAPIIALSANCDGEFAFALDENGNVYAWGANFYGQLGNGSSVLVQNSPVLVASNVIDIYAGETFSYILKSDNTLWASGSSGLIVPLNGSIWMNLTNTARSVFTQVDPTIPPMNLCAPAVFGVTCPGKVNLGNDTTLCEKQQLILSTGFTNAGYLWQDNSIDSEFTVTSPGSYSVTVSQFYCIMVDTINVFYKPLPIAALGNDTSLCKTDKINLHVPQNGAAYLWQDNSTSQNFIVTMPGSYWVSAQLDGCYNADTIIIEPGYCDCILNIPNAITPNGDGINDNWVITERDCILQVDVSVYNRYGSLVYEKKNYKNEWNGKYGSKPVPDGTYYYVVRMLRSDHSEQILKGDLTILR